MINFKKYYDLIKFHNQDAFNNNTRNKEGIVFTNLEIAEKIVFSLKPKLNETILEPSVGAGIFIIALFKYIIETYKPTRIILKNYIENKLYFSDIDIKSLNFTKKIINDFYNDFSNINPEKYIKLDLNFNNEDSLLNNKYYDIIFGNPPYIRTKNLDENYLKFLRNNFISCKSGNIDIYYAFMELANKYSNRSSFIVPNSYLTNNSAKNLRNIIKNNIVEIKNYENIYKFDNANIYTSIFILEQKNKKNKILYSINNEKSKEYNKSFLNEKEWKLNLIEKQITNNNLNKKLKDITNIYSGIATLSDKLYIINDNKIYIKDNEEYYKQIFENKEYLIEKKICIDFKKLSKNLGDNNQKIIFPYKNINTILEEDFIKSNYPKAYEYFLNIKHLLNNRDKGKTSKYDAWYAFGRRQGFNIDFTNKNCILISSIYSNSLFKFKEIKTTERFIHVSGFVLVPNDSEYQKVINILKDKNFQKYLLTFGKTMKGSTENYNSITTSLIKNYGFN